MAGIAFRTLGGEGSDIVLIHGFGSDRLSWLANMPALMPLGKVHALDLPAHGDSDNSIGNGTPAELARRVGKALTERGVVRAHLVGHSLGGGIALLLAADTPRLATSLTLIAPAGLGGGIDGDFLAAFPHLVDVDATMSLLGRLVRRPALINRLTVQRVLAHLGSAGVRPALSAIAEKIATHENDFAGAADRVAAHGVPRFVIWGGEDAINPPDPTRLAAFTDNMLMIDGCGHLPHIEAATSVNGAL